MNWFSCKISYEKLMENGVQKKITEQYLVDALSFTEAEARIIEEMKPYVSGDFSVADISRYKVSEIFSENRGINQIDAEAQKISGQNRHASGIADKWFVCKVNFIMLDEKSGTEKKNPVNMLVQASSVNAAHDSLVECMKDTLSDYEIEKIAETKIMDVFSYNIGRNEKIDN